MKTNISRTYPETKIKSRSRQERNLIKQSKQFYFILMTDYQCSVVAVVLL